MEKCACQGAFLDKFIQPAILVVLSRGSSHGFQMIADLERSGMVSGDSLDPAGLYRTLKKMEGSGLVTSVWDTESASKPRRVYSITPAGRSCLDQWRETLEEYRANLDAILGEIRGLPDETAEPCAP